MLCLSLCVVGKVVDMSNLAAVSDMHGRSPLVCVYFFSLAILFVFLFVSIPCVKRKPFSSLVYRDDINPSITSWHIAISCLSLHHSSLGAHAPPSSLLSCAA